MLKLKIEYNNKIYTVAIANNVDDINTAILNRINIVQFCFLLKENYEKGNKLLNKKSTPSGYKYLSERHCLGGNTLENMNLFNNDIKNGLSVIPTNNYVCYYEANLHGTVNNILKHGKIKM